MKKALFAVLITLFITIIIPLVIVEFTPPRQNAASTEPQATQEAGVSEL